MVAERWEGGSGCGSGFLDEGYTDVFSDLAKYFGCLILMLLVLNSIMFSLMCFCGSNMVGL